METKSSESKPEKISTNEISFENFLDANASEVELKAVEDNFRSCLVAFARKEIGVDVQFLVEDKLIKANRVILAAQSEFFEKLLFGDFAEAKQTTITLNDVKLKPFKSILRYLYTGTLITDLVDGFELAGLLSLAQLYGIHTIEPAVCVYMTKNTDTQNVIPFLECAVVYNLQDVQKTCLDYICKRAEEFLDHQAFNTLSEEALLLIEILVAKERAKREDRKSSLKLPNMSTSGS